MSVSVSEIIAGASVQAVPLAGECAGYLVLAAADQAVAAPRRIGPKEVHLHGDGSVRVEQTLFVARESQRKIALGKGGGAIKAIGTAAREELQEILGRRVHLFLHVKVRETWAEDRDRYTALGLDFDAG